MLPPLPGVLVLRCKKKNPISVTHEATCWLVCSSLLVLLSSLQAASLYSELCFDRWRSTWVIAIGNHLGLGGERWPRGQGQRSYSIPIQKHTRLGQSSQHAFILFLQTHCSTISDLTPKATAREPPLTNCLLIPLSCQQEMMNGINTSTCVNYCVSFPFKRAITRRQLSCILYPASCFLINGQRGAVEHYWLPLQTLKTVKQQLEWLSSNHICNYDNVNWACQGWIISGETVKYT